MDQGKVSGWSGWLSREGAPGGEGARDQYSLPDPALPS